MKLRKMKVLLLCASVDDDYKTYTMWALKILCIPIAIKQKLRPFSSLFLISFVAWICWLLLFLLIWVILREKLNKNDAESWSDYKHLYNALKIHTMQAYLSGKDFLRKKINNNKGGEGWSCLENVLTLLPASQLFQNVHVIFYLYICKDVFSNNLYCTYTFKI